MPMCDYKRYVIKSFKHDGSIHRVWKENWQVPQSLLGEANLAESTIVLINHYTAVEEASGKEWMSKVPAVSYFIPDTWYNIVALLEPEGVRYYCNIASPPYTQHSVLTYIDYDIDIILDQDGKMEIVDLDEYEKHKRKYRYDEVVQDEITQGLHTLKQTIEHRKAPFDNEQHVLRIFEMWKARRGE